MASSTSAAHPIRVRKGGGRYPQPVALLARLGVDVDHEGRGLGAALLADVVGRLVDVSDEIGCRGYSSMRRTRAAPAFYLHLIPEAAWPARPTHCISCC